MVDRAAAARPAPRGAPRRAARRRAPAGDRRVRRRRGRLRRPRGADGLRRRLRRALHRRGAAGRPLGGPAGGPARRSSSSSTCSVVRDQRPRPRPGGRADHRARRARSRPTGRTLVHGDYFPGNVLLGDDLRISAVLDLGWLTVVGDPTHDVRSAVAFWAVRPWSRPGDDAALLAAAQRHLGTGRGRPDRAHPPLRAARASRSWPRTPTSTRGASTACEAASPERGYGTSTTLPPTLRSCRSVSARTTSSSGYSVGSTGWSAPVARQLHELGEQRLVALGIAPGPRPPVDADQGAVVEQHLVDRAAGGSRRRRSRSRGSGPSTAARAGRARRSGRPPGRRPRRPRRRSAHGPAP